MRASRHVPVLSVALVTVATLTACSAGSAVPSTASGPAPVRPWADAVPGPGPFLSPAAPTPDPAAGPAAGPATGPATDPAADPATGPAADPAAPPAPPAPVTEITRGRLTATTFVPLVSEAMLAAGSVTATTRATVGGVPTEAVVDLDMSTADARLHHTSGGVVTDVLAVDGRTYVKGGKTKGRYYPMPRDDLQYAGLSLQADPVRPVRALFGAIVDARTTGVPVDLGGVWVQGYDVVVDTTRLRDSLGDLAAGVPREQLPPQVTLSYLVGEDDLVYRATADVAGVPVEVDYSGWGADLTIAAPTPDLLSTRPPS